MAETALSPSSTLTISPFGVKNCHRPSRAHGILVLILLPLARSITHPCPPLAPRYKYLDALTTAFVVILLVSNLIAQKICLIGPFAVSGAVLLFPITYIFGDIFTEVYGFAASRRAIWLGFFGTSCSTLSAPLSSRCRPRPAGTTSRPLPPSSDLSPAFLPPVSSRSGRASLPTPTPWPG